jgi:hypothetical protein
MIRSDSPSLSLESRNLVSSTSIVTSLNHDNIIGIIPAPRNDFRYITCIIQLYHILCIIVSTLDQKCVFTI